MFEFNQQIGPVRLTRGGVAVVLLLPILVMIFGILPYMAVRKLLGSMFGWPDLNEAAYIVISSYMFSLAALWVIDRFLLDHLGLDRAEIGLRPTSLSHCLFGVGIGIVAVLVTAVLSQIYHQFTDQSLNAEQIEMFGPVAFDGTAFTAFLLSLVFLAPFCEEVLFRGVFYGWLRYRVSIPKAMLISAFVFAFIHFQFLAMIPLMIIGLLFSVAYEKTGSVYPAIIAHATNNAFAALGLLAARHQGEFPANLLMNPWFL